MRENRPRAWYKRLGIMIPPERVESINFETKVIGVYLEMDGRGFHRLRRSDFVLMWPIGLPDRSGKQIYDGDILDGSWLNPMTNELVKKLYEVSYERGRYLAKLIGHHPYGTTLLYFENERAEVIGNIYEDHSLIAEKGAGQ
ncbi:YopX family protein [Cohnella sp.]|uniref:YopX family protein n=1 Tax=Cohnella sp. TaxID=1883426 RepID=UPI00370412B6